MRARRIGTYLAAVVFAIPFLLPFYLLVRNSLMTREELGALTWTWIPQEITLQGYRDAFASMTVPLAQSLGNSLIVAGISAPLSTLLASMCGYALARIRVPISTPVFFLVIGTMMVPGAATFIPTFVVVGAMGGINTLWGIIAPGVFSAFAVILFRAFYLRFPLEIEEAGRIDGLGYLGLYWRLALPNSGGLIAALGILAFIESWNGFLWPLVVGQSPQYWTVQVAVSTHLTTQALNMPALFASAVVAALPLVLLFLIAQRFVVKGVMMSGIKG